MQLNNANDIEKIAPKNNFSIFELPEKYPFDSFFKNSYHVAFQQNKDGKMSREIKKPQIEEMLKICHNKQSDSLIVVVENADKLNLEAANLALKSLEEPGENIHFVFLTHSLDSILPTIRSRANCYYLPKSEKVSAAPEADIEVFKLAKEYVSADAKNLPAIVEKILKLDKNDTRQAALNVISCGIDIMYKSYLLRGNPGFLKKIEQLIAAEQAIDQNGHVKLQLIANML
jgi:DNA polymerase III delta prime subunit